MPVTGHVLSLHRWPVKSMAGEQLDALALDERGAAGDRTHAVVSEHKGAVGRLTAREAPGLLRWQAAYAAERFGPDDPPPATVTAPDGRRFGWDDPALARALAADLGRPVALHRDPAGQQDLERTVLITVEGTRRAVEAELGRPLDLRRFRTNLHVELDAPPYAEEDWEGRRLLVGDVALDLLHPCVRCAIPTRDPDTTEKWGELLRWLTREHGGLFGINARPADAATVRRGDPVQVVAEFQGSRSAAGSGLVQEGLSSSLAQVPPR